MHLFIFLGAINDSIFQYENGRDANYYKDENFVPAFWSNNYTNNTAVNEICKYQRACIYDYMQTNNWGIANNTRNINDEIAVVEMLER